MLSSSSVKTDSASPWYRRNKVLVPLVALVIVVVVLSDLGRPANVGSKKGDFTTFATTVTTDMLSCNASVSDSMTVLREITSGKSKDLATAKTIVAQAQPNCSVAVNSDLLNMSTQTIPTTLAPFRLQRVLTNMDTWAYPNAVQLIADVQTILQTGVSSKVEADMNQRIHAMVQAQNQAQAILDSTAKSLSMAAPQLKLDGLSSVPTFITNSAG